MTIPIERFTITKGDKVTSLTAELSSFGRGPVLELIYPDVPGLLRRRGLTIRGRRAEVVYYLANELKDREGDLEAYLLLPTRESVKDVPAAANTQVLLLND